MEHDEAADRMREIQRIMERTTLHAVLPGMPAVVGGVLALVGAAVSYAFLRSWDFAAVLALSVHAQVGFYALWAAIAIAGVALHVVATLRELARQGLTPRTRPLRLSAYALPPSVFVALALTARLLADGRLDYLAPVWMMCYGTGVYAAGLFSIRLPRLLGLAFIGLGSVGLLLPHHGLLLAAIAFGGFHVVFGLIVIRRSKRSETP